MKIVTWTQHRDPSLLANHEVSGLVCYTDPSTMKAWVRDWARSDLKALKALGVVRFNDAGMGQPWCPLNPVVPAWFDGLYLSAIPPPKEPLRDRYGAAIPEQRSPDYYFDAFHDVVTKIATAMVGLHEAVREQTPDGRTFGSFWDPWSDTSGGLIAVACAAVAGRCLASSSQEPSDEILVLADSLGVAVVSA